MISNYLKIAWRNLLRNRLSSMINIAGLSIGATCFLLIALYVYSQFQYDQHHEAGTSLYRVETEMRSNEEPWLSATTSPPIVPMMQQDFPEVVNATRVVDPPETTHHILKWNNQSFFETKGFYVDSSFFSMFDYHWVEGIPEQALQEPYTVVLTKEVKDKLFGRHAALGESIEINNRFGSDKFKVTGVVDASVYKSHIRPNFYMSMNSGGIGEYVLNNDQWAGGNFIHGYVELHTNAKPEEVLSRTPAFLEKYGGNQMKEYGIEKVLTLQSVPDIHLKSTRDNQLDVTGNMGFLKIILLIAGFILLIACVNFMNLSTARSIKRGTEIGVRKTIGAARGNIVRQFLTESFVVSGISFILALGATIFCLPYVSGFVDVKLEPEMLNSVPVIVGILSFYILTALIAGSYPAAYLSSFKPISIIKGHLKKNNNQQQIRKGLVILQFAVSICMIVGSVVILNQLKYIQQKDLGFSQEQKLIIPFRTSDAREQLLTFKKEAARFPGVELAAGARVYPGQMLAQDFNVYSEGSDMDHSHNVKLVQGDEDYLDVLKIPILQGRNFTTKDTADQILINQQALRTFNISENEAIGQKLYSEYNDQKETYEIVGVVKDYHQISLKEPIQSMIFFYRATERNLALMLDVASGDQQTLISSLEEKWNQLVPGTPFEFHYLDEHIQTQYMEEKKLGQIINLFTLIAIFISCLGLFGLSVFITEQKTKEIGIRKILGASSIGIVGLLSKDFIKLVILALVISIPIAYYFMSRWLSGFEYRIEIEWWIFALSGLAAIAIAVMTIGFQSLKAAMANPADSLRND